MPSKNTITTELFRKFLKNQGLNYLRTKGDHEIWYKTGMTRPVTFQSGKKEVPTGVIRSNLRTLGMSMKQFLQIVSDL